MMTIEQLQQNILNDAALEQQFAACTSPEQVVALAAEHGYTLDVEEVARAFAALPLTPLADAELVQIGGGSKTVHIEDPNLNPPPSTLMNQINRNTTRHRSVRK